MLSMQAVLGALADMYEQGADWLTALQGTGSSSIAKSLKSVAATTLSTDVR